MLVAWRGEVEPDPDAVDDAGPPVRDRLLDPGPAELIGGPVRTRRPSGGAEWAGCRTSNEIDTPRGPARVDTDLPAAPADRACSSSGTARAAAWTRPTCSRSGTRAVAAGWRWPG